MCATCNIKKEMLFSNITKDIFSQISRHGWSKIFQCIKKIRLSNWWEDLDTNIAIKKKKNTSIPNWAQDIFVAMFKTRSKKTIKSMWIHNIGIFIDSKSTKDAYKMF